MQDMLCAFLYCCNFVERNKANFGVSFSVWKLKWFGRWLKPGPGATCHGSGGLVIWVLPPLCSPLERAADERPGIYRRRCHGNSFSTTPPPLPNTTVRFSSAGNVTRLAEWFLMRGSEGRGWGRNFQTFPAVVSYKMQWCGSSAEQFQESGLTDGNRKVLVTTREALVYVQ
jgi:hypothetical protein